MHRQIALSKNDIAVLIDDRVTNATLHIHETPDLLDLVSEVVSTVELAGDDVAIEKDLDRIVGKTSLVETKDSDEIIYAKRLHRDKYTRFVKKKSLLPTGYVTVILRKAEEGYVLWSAWCGRLVPTSPGGQDEMAESRVFWSNHALVYDEKIIQKETITKICPWS